MPSAICPPPVLPPHPSGTVVVAAATSQGHVNERFYKFGCPSPAEQGSPLAYSDLDDGSFHSDEEIEKVC